MSTEKQISQQSYADADDRIETGETPPETTLEGLKAVGAAGRTLPTARLTVGDLTSHHLGKTVRIHGPHDRWQVTGILYRIDHEAAEVEDHTLCDPVPEVTAGRQTVTLKVGPFTLTDDGTDRVEVL